MSSRPSSPGSAVCHGRSLQPRSVARHWRPAVIGFVQGWLKEGLRPRAITRDLDWGVPIPLEGFDDKRIYVWFDAVIGYLSASMEWAELQGDPDGWKRWWVLDESGNPPGRSYYFVGKDNTPFHAIIWPAMLMGYGGLALPYDVPANEFLTLDGQKLSSLGHRCRQSESARRAPV